MDLCDLHTHSTFSDGTCTPEELVALAADSGLKALALTDHNTVDGLERFRTAALSCGITPVSGCEFSTGHGENELHIVGLFLPDSCLEEVGQTVRDRNEKKHSANRECIFRLREGGYPITYEAVLEAAGSATPNRAHIARELVRLGLIGSVPEAFRTILHPSSPYYVQAPLLSATGIIRSIRRWGGLSVWAHPPLSASLQCIPDILSGLRAAGLDAVETLYSAYTEAQQRYMEREAERLGLLHSGGSDFHGSNKPDIRPGDPGVPYSVYEELSRAAAQRR